MLYDIGVNAAEAAQLFGGGVVGSPAGYCRGSLASAAFLRNQVRRIVYSLLLLVRPGVWPSTPAQ